MFLNVICTINYFILDPLNRASALKLQFYQTLGERECIESTSPSTEICAGSECARISKGGGQKTKNRGGGRKSAPLFLLPHKATPSITAQALNNPLPSLWLLLLSLPPRKALKSLPVGDPRVTLALSKPGGCFAPP